MSCRPDNFNGIECSIVHFIGGWKWKVLLSLISERLHYLAYIGALILSPSGGGVTCCEGHSNVTVLSEWNFLSRAFITFLFLTNICLFFFFSPYVFILTVLPSGEPVAECRRYVQVRNITKGDCRLDNVEVSFCRGRCLSRTDVILEVQRQTHTQHTLLTSVWLAT